MQPSHPPSQAGPPSPDAPAAQHEAPISHDQLFKELFREFFQEFFELFFPNVAAQLDFSTVTFLDKELFTDLNQRTRREADLVAEVSTRDGQPRWVIIHIEVESRRRRGFPKRMFWYFTLLWQRHRRPVFPVAVFLSAGSGGLVRERYEERPFDGEEGVSYCYACVGLPDLPAAEYEERTNPLAPALSALMRAGRAGRALRKALILWRTLHSEMDEARKSLLVNVIETYLPLKGEEAEEFERITGEGEIEEVKEMITIYEQRGIEKGRAEALAEAEKQLTIFEQRGIAKGLLQGREEGAVRGKQGLLVRLLTRKFGPLPEEAAGRIAAMSDEGELDRLSERVLDADSLSALGLAGPTAQ